MRPESGSGPRAGRAFLAVITLVAVAAEVLVAVAQSPSKPGEEIWTAPARAARKENPLEANVKSLTQGKELFLAACLPCHGATGKGDGPAAATLERAGVPVRPGNLSNPKLREQTDGALFWKISEGRTPMPAFQEGYTDEQRWQIINYVRSLVIQQGSTNQPAKSVDKK